MKLYKSQHLQLQIGGRLLSCAVHHSAPQPVSAVGRVAARSQADETLEVLRRQE